MHPPVSLNSPAQQHTPGSGLSKSNICWLQGDTIMTSATALCESLCSSTSVNSFHRPSTGIQVWMRWKELSQIIKERSSTDSLESGMKRFSAETRHQPRASGEQVRQVSFMRTHWKSFLRCMSPWYVSDAVDVICVWCRCNASGPREVLWFYQICYWAEWAGAIPETAATTHRHKTTFGPKVRDNTEKSNLKKHQCMYLDLSNVVIDGFLWSDFLTWYP